MDKEDIKTLFEEKYAKIMGSSYEQWAENGPIDEATAYARLEAIDTELKQTEEQWQEATGEEKEQLGDYREQLRAEYEFIESAFGLESGDANW